MIRARFRVGLLAMEIVAFGLLALLSTGRGASESARHWSVQPVVRPAVPDVSGGQSFIRNPIDAFVLARLGEKGLRPSPEADRRTLVRRLYFDLLGLPPSPAQVEAFIHDPAPDAWERLVDQVLDSPHYGERWARHWLDTAHYADTHGFERDQLRPNAWRYRDYVIRSLNADKPYNQFLREQIAGDVLSPNDPDSVIATGFLAAGPWDFVGQVETKSDMLNRAARADDLDDMVTQVITSTMGLTINCARCHDHKIDPISQKEYYQLWAVFAGVHRGDREIDSVGKAAREERVRNVQAQLRQVRAELGRLSGEGLDLADMVGAGDGRGSGEKGLGIDVRTGNFTEEKLGYHRDILNNRLQELLWTEKLGPNHKFVQWVFVPNGGKPVPVAYKLEVNDLPATSGHFWDIVRNGPLNAQVSTIIDDVDYNMPGHSILGLHANAGVTFNLAEIRSANGFGAMRLTARVGFGARKEAAATQADFTVFVDDHLALQRLKLRKDQSFDVDVTLPAEAKYLSLVATDGGDGISHDLLFLGDPRLSPANATGQLAAMDRERIKELKAAETKLREDLEQASVVEKVYAVTSDKPPLVHILQRGSPESPLDEVTPGAISWAGHANGSFGENASNEGQRRLALADWIVHPDNPLTRRVIMNRLWHYHFGQGIVNTPSDFGHGGDKPSHPALLDWLADEFLRQNWSLKAMHRLICNSATYRQVSDQSLLTSAATVDSGNRLLWRQNPRRLDAESMRDTVLFVAGTLNTSMGGPGYRDFKYTEAYAPIYDYITADKPELWRRSIYRFVVRTTPQQFLTTLDCPNPANLTPARNTTTTPLQSLALMNNEFMLKQAEAFAGRVGRVAGTSLSDQVGLAFQLAFQRRPTSDEAQGAIALAKREGMFQLCRVLLNASEFLYVD